MPTLAQLPACRVGMEACAGAHYWARQLQALGHQVTLIPPQHVEHFNWVVDRFILQGRAPEREILATLALNF